jgi:PAS domain S-box-containing protein
MTNRISTWWPNPPVILRYAVAVALVAGATAIEQWMEEQLVGAPALLFLCAVMLSAWFGGFRPGLFAAALALLTFVYYFVSPEHSLAIDPKELPRVAIFAFSVLFAGLLSAAQRSVAQSLRRARDELDGANREMKLTNECLRAENAERVRVEEALRQSEQRFRDFAETGSDWLWETGPDHRFTHVSGHLNTAGIAPATRLGQRRWEVAADVAAEPEKWRAHITALDAHQPFRDLLYKVIRTDGTTVHINTSGKPVFDPQGRFLGYRGVGSDFTAEVQGREAEKALRQAQAELAHVTRVTTLGELTASIVHEVNQPLAAISMNGEACLRFLDQQAPDLNEVRGALVDMIGNSHRAADVIRRIRALCQKAEPQKALLNITEVIDEVLYLIQREVIDHGVAIRREFSPEIAPVLGDRIELQQVIINLVMNGMEAMSAVVDRQRDLLIRSQQSTDEVLVTVQDGGIGIAPENVDRLFNSFYTTKPGGMGMGLSICRSIIEAHGGKLWASSNSGQGATFQFTLPCQQETSS